MDLSWLWSGLNPIARTVWGLNFKRFQVAPKQAYPRTGGWLLQQSEAGVGLPLSFGKSQR